MLEKLFNEIMRKVVRQIPTREIYLDHAATTPHHPLVLQVMKQAMRNYYANPSAIHKKGTAVRQRIDSARAQVARLLGTTSNHIIFTRGGTESNTLAIMGVINYVLSHPQVTQGARPHVITSAIEHAVVLETLRELEAQELIQLSVIPVDREGLVLVEVIKQELRPETVLVSIMYANNEIGTIQPIKEIAKLLRWHRKQMQVGAGGKSKMVLPLLHTDAIQAVNYLDVHVERLGVDLMSISGSKIYGPKSSGGLYVRNRD
jgi:cysteine desulfurase